MKKNSKHSKETKKKISLSKKGKPSWNKGRKLSEKHKSNLRGKRPNARPWNYIDGRSKNQSWFRYGSDWNNIRKAVLIRDNFTCQYCFMMNIKFDIHHKIPFLLTKDNSLNNLITLCDKCHRKEEVRIMKELNKQGGN